MRRLSDGALTMRRATAADTDAVAAFNADVSRYQDTEQPDESIAAWTRDLMAHAHPRCSAGDFIVVEEARTGRIVSSVALIAQTWSYAGIEVEVGQPELVGTHPDYRGRGLVREQFAALHERSAARRQRLLAIDGIPWFYRQFGYEMALGLRAEFSIETARLPDLPARQPDPYRVRPAVAADLRFIAHTYEQAAARYLVACRRDAATWEYELTGRNEHSPWRYALGVVEMANGQAVGVVVHAPRPSGTTLGVTAYELTTGVGWAEVTPSVLRYLRSTGEAYASLHGQPRLERIGLCLGEAHPAYASLRGLAPRDDGAYAWYLRVPNLPDFVRHIAPILERRLSESALARYSGELRLSFTREGMRLAFEAGRLTTASAWRQPRHLAGVEKGVPTRRERWTAVFPGLTFLQLLFGYRSLEELQHAFADCVVRTDEARDLLRAVFPKQPSNVWPVL